MHPFRPVEPSGRQPEPGDRVGLDHVWRCAPGMPGAGDTLHRRDRWHSHFYRTAGGDCLKLVQQIPRGGPQRVSRRFLSAVDGGAYLSDAGGTLGIGLTRGHEPGQPKRAGSVLFQARSSSPRGIASWASTVRLSPPVVPRTVIGT